MKYARLYSLLIFLVSFSLLAGCSTDSLPSAENLETQNLTNLRIVAAHSSKCLEIEGDSVNNGAAAEQRECDRESHSFNLVPVPGILNTYTIVNKESGKCLDVFRGGLENGTALVQYRCGEGSNQYFRFTEVTYANMQRYQLKALHSGKCLDVFRAQKTDGTKIVQYTCHTEPERTQQGNQLWSLTDPPSGGNPKPAPSN